MSRPRDAAPTLRWRRVDEWQVMFTEPDTPVPDDLVGDLVATLDDPGLCGCLSVIGSDGFAKITPRHLQLFASVLQRHEYSLAVITSHRITLAMVTSLAWVGAKVRGFRAAELEQAMIWLGVPEPSRSQLREIVGELRDGTPPHR